MKIALFCGNYNYLREGANQALNRLAAYCESQGDAFRAYSPVTDTPAFEPAGTLVPVPSVPLPVRGEFRLALGLPPAARRDVRAFAPDLVHVASPDILGHRALTLARRLRVPAVASFHTRFETYPEHYRLGWTRPAVEKLLHRFYRRADLVLAPNPATAAEMSEIVGANRVRIWSRGIDRDLFALARRDLAWRRSQGWADDDVVLLFFGRLVREKGTEIFLQTLARLHAAGHRVRALAVGAGPEAPHFSTAPDIVQTGHLDGEPLARIVASADILLHPSLTETFGNVMLEGMASGLAVIAADTPGARHLLRHGENGLLCAAEPAAMTAAVETLLVDPQARRGLGASARKSSVPYSWEAASAQARDAYRELLAERAVH
ncbi:MAG: glycosyltransferase family 4 protein [Sphingosinicella sp.]